DRSSTKRMAANAGSEDLAGRGAIDVGAGALLQHEIVEELARAAHHPLLFLIELQHIDAAQGVGKHLRQPAVLDRTRRAHAQLVAAPTALDLDRAEQLRVAHPAAGTETDT